PAKLMSLKFAQPAGDPSRHGRHRPQGRKLTATWSPGATFSTALPTASTTPAPSCPRTTGSGIGYTWSRTTRSVWHSPAATTRTGTSSSRGGSSAVVVIANAPFSLTTAPVISLGAVTEAAIRIPTSAVLVQAPRHRGFAGRVRFTRSTPSPEVQALEPWAPDADPSARLSSGGPARRGGPPEAAGGALLRLRPTTVPVDAVCGAGRRRLRAPFVGPPGPPGRSAGSGGRRAPPAAPHNRPGRCGVRRRLRAAVRGAGRPPRRVPVLRSTRAAGSCAGTVPHP